MTVLMKQVIGSKTKLILPYVISATELNLAKSSLITGVIKAT